MSKSNGFLSNEKAQSTPVGVGLGMGVAILMAIFIFATIQEPMVEQITTLNNSDATAASNSVIGFVWVFIILAGIAIIVIGAKVVMSLVNNM